MKLEEGLTCGGAYIKLLRELRWPDSLGHRIRIDAVQLGGLLGGGDGGAIEGAVELAERHQGVGVLDQRLAVARADEFDVAVLDRVLGLDVGPTPHMGSPTTVNVAHWAFSAPADDFPFLTTAGPSMRHVVDMGNLDGTGGFVIGTGQSGIPFSRHYDDQRPVWSEGGLLGLPLGREAVEARTTRTLILEPQRRE